MHCAARGRPVRRLQSCGHSSTLPLIDTHIRKSPGNWTRVIYSYCQTGQTGIHGENKGKRLQSLPMDLWICFFLRSWDWVGCGMIPVSMFCMYLNAWIQEKYRPNVGRYQVLLLQRKYCTYRLNLRYCTCGRNHGVVQPKSVSSRGINPTSKAPHPF